MLSYKIVVLVMVFLHRQRTLRHFLWTLIAETILLHTWLSSSPQLRGRFPLFLQSSLLQIKNTWLTLLSQAALGMEIVIYTFLCPIRFSMFYEKKISLQFLFYKRLKLHWAASCLETPFLVPFCTRLFLIFSSTSFGSNITCAIFLSSLKLCIFYFFSHVCSF